MGNTSLNTRSSPTSARSAPLPSGCKSDWNARVWMSRRCGIGIPWSSLANDSTGSVFVMSRPQANAKGPTAPDRNAGRGGTEGLVQASRSVANPRMWSTKEDMRGFATVLLACRSRSEEHTAELQSRLHLVGRRVLLKEKRRWDEIRGDAA